MRGSREISIVLCAALVGLSGCSRGSQPPPHAAVTSNPEQPAPVPTLEAPSAAVAPTESGLSIKRGVATLAQDRTTFRACGGKDELWLLDQTSAGLAQTFENEMRDGSATTLYIEAYGERAPVADDVPDASTYAGMFVLEQVLYAGVPGDVRGCDAPAHDYIVAARGNEPFWAVEVEDGQMVWRQPQTPEQIDLGAPQTQSAEGTVTYEASTNEHQLELLIDAQDCRDSMSGEFFAYTAKAQLDGTQFSGCARLGR